MRVMAAPPGCAVLARAALSAARVAAAALAMAGLAKPPVGRAEAAVGGRMALVVRPGTVEGVRALLLLLLPGGRVVAAEVEATLASTRRQGSRRAS